MSKKILIENRKARFNYFLEKEYTAGIILSGTEVKSVLSGKVSMVDGWIQIKNNLIVLMNVEIQKFGDYSHELKRERILLLNKSEKAKLEKFLKMNSGSSIIPIDFHYSETKKIKVTIALAKGKKNFDKKDTIKERDVKRDLARSYE
jgi:SsrA-binding protein